jgi:hypothetical protein
LLTTQTLDPERLRLGFVLYGAMNRKDWRTASISDIAFDSLELREQLIPLLSASGIDGESMSPEYPDNAVALFEAVEGRQFTFGKEYLIWFSDSECYFSRVIESDDDRDVLILQKINSDRERFPDRKVHRREIARVAFCVGVLIRKK